MRVLALFFSFLFCVNSSATDMVGAISAGMGGTGRAAVEANESLYLNPSSLALLDRMYFGSSYQSGFLDNDISRNTYSMIIADGSSGLPAPGALGFRRHKINSQGFQYKENEFRLGLGYRITPRISFGFSYAHLSAEDQLGASFSQDNGDVGFLFGLMPNWGLSLTGENVIETTKPLPVALQRRSRVALGTQYIYERSITLRYEALMPLYTENTDKLGHRAGMGFDLQGNFQLNVGYSVDDLLGQNWASAGLAWRGPRLRLAYSFQNEDRQRLGQRHLVDLWVDI